MRQYGYNDKFDISDLISEKEKSSYEYLRHNIDWHIASLVYEKEELKDAYNYYNGILDKERFKYIEDNYGIGNPSCVEFVPLIRRHVDALVGELLTESIQPRITCKDSTTLLKIEDEKKVKILEDFIDFFTSTFKTNLEKKQDEESLVANFIATVKEDIEKTWHSRFEISAQHILTNFIQDREMSIHDKIKTLFTDLLITGSCYYRVYAKEVGEDPIFEVVNPLDIFYNKNTNYTFLKSVNRVVHRMFMTRQEALNRYGHYMTEDDKKVLFGNEVVTASGEARFLITKSERSDNYLVSNTGTTITNSRATYFGDDDIIKVYHVEWIANNAVPNESEDFVDTKTKKTRWRLDRYEGVRIGDHIYVKMGKSTAVTRSVDKPYRCTISYNGVSYSDRNSRPYSLVIALMDLQDKYNLLHFYRNTIIANSSIPGPIIDVAALPTFLGKTPAERLLKWKAYGKSGLYLINSAQQGQSHINTIYSGMQIGLDAGAIQTINGTIQLIEETASQISGVFRERLGMIEQRDAVTNVKVGIRQSAIITKQFFALMDEIKREVLTDLINTARFTYKSGKKGAILLGGRQQLFSVEPEYFSMTDYDVHISTSGEELRDIETAKSLAMELVKGGAVDVDIILTILTSKSLTDIKDKVQSNLKSKKNEQMQQMQQQIKQLEEELKKAGTELQKVNAEETAIKKAELEVKKQKLAQDKEIKEKELAQQAKFNADKIKEGMNRVELEKAQLYVGKSKEVRNE